jgi:hypothetical protein
MSQTQMSLTRAMSISSLADNIGELRVQDIEKKVNPVSFRRSHLYSDVARSCGRRTHNAWLARRALFARVTKHARTIKIADKKTAILNADASRPSAVEMRRTADSRAAYRPRR